MTKWIIIAVIVLALIGVAVWYFTKEKKDK